MRLIYILTILVTVATVWAEPVFVVGSKVTLSSLSKENIESILKGKMKTWSTGERIDLVVLSGGSTNQAVLSTYASLDPDQFDSHWQRLVFTGKATMPKKFSTEAEVAKYIATSDYGLGYVDSSVAGSLKTLKVE
jgi:ABC-type phosphate transport system substrate-binding protein